ncbi:MAG: Crp/Fnr family transcriptional regulator [Acidobacteriota bacterium]
MSGTNLLLQSLPSRDFARLEPHLRPYRTSSREELHCRAESDPDVFFPMDSVSSIVVRGLDGGTLEVATVGSEGMIGLPVFIDSEAVAFDAITQVPGEGFRMSCRVLKRELARKAAFADRIVEYTEAVLLSVGQSGLCARMHSQVQRCARWLLTIDDRAARADYPITHDFLGQMLGVRRATITQAIAELKKKRLVQAGKRALRIRDRQGLERVVCECYVQVRTEFDAIRRRWRREGI